MENRRFKHLTVRVSSREVASRTAATRVGRHRSGGRPLRVGGDGGGPCGASGLCILL